MKVDPVSGSQFAVNSGSIRSSPPEVFLGKGVPKICSKLTREYPCRSVILTKLQSNFIEITLWHGRSPVNFQQVSEHLFLKAPLDGCVCFSDH